MKPSQLRANTKIKTAKGWFVVKAISFKRGAAYKAELMHNGKSIGYFDAEELCKHITEWDVI
jgi:hypothetical protein